MSRVLKREDVKSLTGHRETLRIISSYCGFSKKSRLTLTLNSSCIKDGWELPFHITQTTKAISYYDKGFNAYMRVDIEFVKKFLNSYRTGLFLEAFDE